MKNQLFLLMLTLFTFNVIAQEFAVPQDYELEKAEDYATYENDVINCVNWIIKTPATEQTNKRTRANAFLIKWVMGSPNVHIEINENIVTFMESSPDMLIHFLGGWAKYSLETKDFDNKIDGGLAGVNAVIMFYEANKDVLKKDKNIEKYVKMKHKGILKDYITKNS